MKQTAVEWLIDQLITENEVTLKGENYKLFDIAKEMEKDSLKLENNTITKPLTNQLMIRGKNCHIN